jgi:acyl-CoA thioester hydrolase
MTEKLRDQRIEDFPYRMTIPTRWGDNDMLGHVNNVLYYRYFEAIVVRFLMEQAGVHWLKDPSNPQAVESLCRFHRSLSFPDVIEGTLRVEKIGNSSITFGVALFGSDDDRPAATGHIVEVFVDAKEGKSVPITSAHRAIFEKYF